MEASKAGVADTKSIGPSPCSRFNPRHFEMRAFLCQFLSFFFFRSYSLWAGHRRVQYAVKGQGTFKHLVSFMHPLSYGAKTGYESPNLCRQSFSSRFLFPFITFHHARSRLRGLIAVGEGGFANITELFNIMTQYNREALFVSGPSSPFP